MHGNTIKIIVFSLLTKPGLHDWKFIEDCVKLLCKLPFRDVNVQNHFIRSSPLRKIMSEIFLCCILLNVLIMFINNSRFPHHASYIYRVIGVVRCMILIKLSSSAWTIPIKVNSVNYYALIPTKLYYFRFSVMLWLKQLLFCSIQYRQWCIRQCRSTKCVVCDIRRARDLSVCPELDVPDAGTAACCALADAVTGTHVILTAWEL